MPTLTQPRVRVGSMTVAAALRKDRNGGTLTAMQHRHYAAVAKILADIPHADVRADVAERFADAFAVNPRFDRERFMRAAVVDGVLNE